MSKPTPSPMEGQMGSIPLASDRPDCLQYMTRGAEARALLASFLREALEKGHTLESLIAALHAEAWDSGWCGPARGSLLASDRRIDP